MKNEYYHFFELSLYLCFLQITSLVRVIHNVSNKQTDRTMLTNITIVFYNQLLPKLFTFTRPCVFKVGIPGEFWVQNTQHFKPMRVFLTNHFSYNERNLIGPGAHSPQLKTAIKHYLWYVQIAVVFHWCLSFTVNAILIEHQWNTCTTDLWTCHKYSMECAPDPITNRSLQERQLGWGLGWAKRLAMVHILHSKITWYPHIVPVVEVEYLMILHISKICRLEVLCSW